MHNFLPKLKEVIIQLNQSPNIVEQIKLQKHQFSETSGNF